MRRYGLVSVLCLLIVFASSGFTLAGELAPDASPCYIIPIDGTLLATDMDTYGPFQLAEGESFSVQVTWSPACSSVSVRLIPCDGLKWIQVTLYGGSGMANFSIRYTGWYCIGIRNNGPCTITYYGSIYLF